MIFYKTPTPGRTKERKILRCVQCDTEVPENLRENVAYFPSIFEITSVSDNDIGDFMRKYAEEGRKMSQPRKKLLSSYTSQKKNTDYSCAVALTSTGSRCYKITPLG